MSLLSSLFGRDDEKTKKMREEKKDRMMKRRERHKASRGRRRGESKGASAEKVVGTETDKAEK